MKTLAISSLAIAVFATAAFATGGVSTLTEHVRNTLTTIDTIPTKILLDDAFELEGGALPRLAEIATDKDIDIGVRVRAIHGLGKYCPVPCDNNELAHESLTALIELTENETLGEPVVLLRAAIETLGALKVSEDYALLVNLLDHPSRDIRAATARALRDTCNNQAIFPLRVRYTAETSEQVKLAISEALRILGQCGG